MTARRGNYIEDVPLDAKTHPFREQIDKAALADEIESYLRPKPRSGQHVGTHAFNRREWLAKYDAIGKVPA